MCARQKKQASAIGKREERDEQHRFYTYPTLTRNETRRRDNQRDRETQKRASTTKGVPTSRRLLPRPTHVRVPVIGSSRAPKVSPLRKGIVDLVQLDVSPSSFRALNIRDTDFQTVTNDEATCNHHYLSTHLLEI